MRNLIYQLEPRLYPPFHLKKKVERFKIYIDESILYEQHEENMVARLFITAFYAVKATDLANLNYDYRRVIYHNKDINEKKSNQVPDKTNKQALEVAQKYLSTAHILERPTVNYAQFGDWKKSMFLSLELLSYIQPIKEILYELKKQAIDSEFEVDVIVDRTSENCTDPCLTLNKNLLQRLAQEVSEPEKQVKINYQTAHSRDSYGIQVADMLAGAYRKEILYRANQSSVTLIPFSYQKKILDENLKENSDFLRILGQIVYDQIPQNSLPVFEPTTKKKAVKVNHKLKLRLSFNPLSFLYRDLKQKFWKLSTETDILSETIMLLHRLKLIDNTSRRGKVIQYCCNLNDHLTRVAKAFELKPHLFSMTLSRKIDNPHYEKTLDNLQKNLVQLKKKADDPFTLKVVTAELKSFNKKIKKYC